MNVRIYTCPLPHVVERMRSDALLSESAKVFRFTRGGKIVDPRTVRTMQYEKCRSFRAFLVAQNGTLVFREYFALRHSTGNFLVVDLFAKRSHNQSIAADSVFQAMLNCTEKPINTQVVMGDAELVELFALYGLSHMVADSRNPEQCKGMLVEAVQDAKEFVRSIREEFKDYPFLSLWQTQELIALDVLCGRRNLGEFLTSFERR